jgi:hypothetical protein
VKSCLFFEKAQLFKWKKFLFLSFVMNDNNLVFNKVFGGVHFLKACTPAQLIGGWAMAEDKEEKPSALFMKIRWVLFSSQDSFF